MEKIKSIPKIVHLIWLGDFSKFPFNLNMLKEYMPNYEVKVWSNDDFDWEKLLKVPYVKKAYEEKQWAFLSDYLRLHILYDNGGVYLDTDMELLKNIEPLFENKELVLSFENNITVSMGICGAVPKHNFFKRLIDIYDQYIDGGFIMGNMLWDYAAKKELGIKLDGKCQYDSNWIVYEFRKMSLITIGHREKIRNNQYAVHNHKVSWVPKKFQSICRKTIGVTQKLTFLNNLHWLVLYKHRKRMYRDYIKSSN